MKANYPVEFLAASMTLDMGNTDKLVGIPRRGRAARHQGRAAVDQPLGRRFRRRGQHDPLRARGAEGRRPAGGRSDRRGARRPAVPRPRPTSPAASIRAPSTSACWKASPPPAPSMRSSPTARARMPASTPCWRRRSARTRPRPSARTSMFGGASTRETSCAMPAVEPWLPADRLQREYDAIGFFLSGHPLDDYAAAAQAAERAVAGPSSRAR